MDVIKSGLFKGAGIPGTSLDANQRKMLQDEVDEIHADFKGAVKAVREFVDDASMEGQTFSGKKAAEAGLVTSLVNGFDELMVSLNEQVAAQMEADEENDERQEVAEIVGEECEEEEDEDYGMSRMASARALAGVKLPKPVKASDEEEEDAEDEDAEDEKKDGVPAQPEDAEMPPKMDEEGEGEDGDDPDKDEAKAEAEKDAEEEADAGEKAVDTDSDAADKSKHKRNKSRGVA
jgi:hypothetical protein